MDAYDRLIKLGTEKFGLKIAFKNENALMRTLGAIMFFNPAFSERYTTVLGKTVYFPNREYLVSDKDRAARTLAHEFVHISDAKRLSSPVFFVGYLFPQVLSLLALLAIFCTKWWLVSLVFLLPWPAPLRTYLELRGYSMSDAVAFKTTGRFLPLDFLHKQFTTSMYYFMWPFSKNLDLRIATYREKIKSGKLANDVTITNEILSCFGE